MNTSHIPILVALVGLVLYMCPTPTKVAEAGRLMFAVGLLVALFLWRRGAFLLLLVPLAGCGAGQQFAAYAEATRDVIAVAEPCLVAAKTVEVQACEQAPNVDLCRMQVNAQWEPVALALDLVHHAWCAIQPDSEGCAR